jgi:DNA-binding transcriptional MerR regulator
MSKQPENKYTLEMLAEKTDLSRRAIRYYIHRGLLPPPFGAKKGSYYTDLHLERLLLINKMSSQGVPLITIKETLATTQKESLVERFWREAQMFEGVRLSYLPNTLTRSDVTIIHQFINELMNDKGHPDYRKAVESENAAILNGNLKFQGIGYNNK